MHNPCATGPRLTRSLGLVQVSHCLSFNHKVQCKCMFINNSQGQKAKYNVIDTHPTWLPGTSMAFKGWLHILQNSRTRIFPPTTPGDSLVSFSGQYFSEGDELTTLQSIQLVSSTSHGQSLGWNIYTYPNILSKIFEFYKFVINAQKESYIKH